MNLIQISVILLVFNYQLESIDAGSDGTVQENAGQKKLNEKFCKDKSACSFLFDTEK